MAALTECTLRLATLYSTIPAFTLLLVPGILESLVCFLCFIMIVACLATLLVYPNKNRN